MSLRDFKTKPKKNCFKVSRPTNSAMVKPSHFTGLSWSQKDPARSAHNARCHNTEFWGWQHLWGNPSCMSSLLSSGAIYWNSIYEHSITRFNVKIYCQNHYIFQSYLKTLTAHNFWFCCLLKFSKKHKQICSIIICSHKIGLSHVGMNSGQLVYIFLSVFEIPVFYLDKVCKIFHSTWRDSRTQLLAKWLWQELGLSYFLLLWYVQLIE